MYFMDHDRALDISLNNVINMFKFKFKSSISNLLSYLFLLPHLVFSASGLVVPSHNTKTISSLAVDTNSNLTLTFLSSHLLCCVSSSDPLSLPKNPSPALLQGRVPIAIPTPTSALGKVIRLRYRSQDGISLGGKNPPSFQSKRNVIQQ